ncbi:MAG: zinc ribbon domain-containing protein [Bacteroidales bacterium]|nr:zinc ribbon domain-containing protein [Bacteroidales bacterium]
MSLSNKYNINIKEDNQKGFLSFVNLGNGYCTYCRHTISDGSEICPHCGRKQVSYCTFCGAPMGPEEKECSQCGAPAGGIICPKCGSLSFRAFCPECNEPLTRAAKKAVEKAHSDPKFQQLQELVSKAEELRAQIENASLNEPLTIHEKESEPRTIDVSKPNDSMEVDNEEASSKSSIISDSSKKDLEQLEIDIDKLLSEMLPPAGSTPQQQRNYFCARKIEVVKTKTITKTVKNPIGWVCNLCGCTHRQPSECAMPELGGRWIYGASRTYTETITTKTSSEIKD